MFSLSL